MGWSGGPDKQTCGYQGGGLSAYQEPAGATVGPEDTSRHLLTAAFYSLCLLRALRGVRMGVLPFSKSYGDSTLCMASMGVGTLGSALHSKSFYFRLGAAWLS